MALRAATGAAGAVLLAVAMYFSAWIIGRTLAVGLAAGVLLAALAFIQLALRGRSPSVVARVRDGLAAIAVLGSGAPLVLLVFAHHSPERYLWVIAQPGPCAHLGSAAVTVSALLIGWSAATGALGVLVATRRPGAELLPGGGALLGGAICAAGALVALAAPTLAAALLGCAA